MFFVPTLLVFFLPIWNCKTKRSRSKQYTGNKLEKYINRRIKVYNFCGFTCKLHSAVSPKQKSGHHVSNFRYRIIAMPTFYRANVADSPLDLVFSILKVPCLNPNTLPSSLRQSSVTPGFKLHHWHLLTYSMVQNISWEANEFAASQEIPRRLIDSETVGIVTYFYEGTPSPSFTPNCFNAFLL